MTKTDAKAPKGRRAAKPAKTSQPQGSGPPGPSPSDGPGKPGTSGKSAKTSGGRGRKGRNKASSPESFVPTLPSINVLPPAVTERAHVERLRRGFAVAAVVAVAGVGAAFALQAGAISSANDTLAQEEARSVQLSGEVASLAPVKTYYATVQSDEATIQETMSREVLLSDVVDQLYATVPSGVDLGTVSIAVSSDPVPPAGSAAAAVPVDPAAVSGACPSPDPYGVPGASAGCITITGTAVSRAVLGDWESLIGRSDLFANLFISSSDAGAAEGSNAITFSASVSVTDAAYVNRYADKAFVEGTAK